MVVPQRTRRFASTDQLAAKAAPRPKYDHQWKKLRDRRIQHEPLCRHCMAMNRITPAEQVDHIIPRVSGGPDTWENTQSLCGACHRLKTANENRGRFSTIKRV